jgi:hypothetical protein
MEKMTIGPKPLLFMMCLCVVWCGGCFTKRQPTVHLTGVVLAHPVLPSGTASESAGEAPDIEVDAMAMPPRLAVPRAGPARPHVAPAPPAEPPATEKAAEPILLPELTPEQANAAKAETQRSLDAAESTLAQAQGKQMNATQRDVASKVRGFMDSAREAMRNGDWARAKNQARKAEVLAQQLAENP